ncbi:hypothetical protein, partial [Xanthomonas sp. LMG 8989]|uniref:hypothetical protein n=1 Tax=Xanthomonas sp. LMG 8989 TaxID=1591156 RepID=UPI001F1F70A7
EALDEQAVVGHEKRKPEQLWIQEKKQLSIGKGDRGIIVGGQVPQGGGGRGEKGGEEDGREEKRGRMKE